MSNKIIGKDSAYRYALDKKGKNMVVAANLVIEMSERIGELENAVIDLKACLRTCKSSSVSALDQYKDL